MNTCETCRHLGHPDTVNRYGLCQRYPPVPLMVSMQPAMLRVPKNQPTPAQPIVQSQQPVVAFDGCCGEWALKPATLNA